MTQDLQEGDQKEISKQDLAPGKKFPSLPWLKVHDSMQGGNEKGVKEER